MVQVGAYQQVNNYYNTPKADQRIKQQTEKTQAGYVDKKKESGLSRQAQDVLKQLRSKYKDMDFMVMNKGDDAKKMLSKGTKEFSVLFSSDELEKMASDDKYMEEKIKDMEGAVRMSKEINQKFGYEQALGAAGTKDTEITKIAPPVFLQNWRNQAPSRRSGLRKPETQSAQRTVTISILRITKR